MSDFLKLLFGMGIVVLVIGFSALIFEKFVTEETITIKVSKKEIKISENGEEYYLIHTREEIFIDRNNSFHGKSNAKELALKIRTGEKYRVKVVGFNFGAKIPYFMEYRNILKIVNSKTFIVN